MNDFDKRIKESKNEILESQINNPKELYEKAKTYNKKPCFNFKKHLVLKYAMIFILVITLAFTFVFVHTLEKNKLLSSYANGTVSNNVVNVANKTELTNLFTAKNDDTTPFMRKVVTSLQKILGLIIGNNPGPTGQAGTQGSFEKGDYKTNTQELNVDEADIVKVKENYIYYIPNDESNYIEEDSLLYILQANDDGLEIVKKINYLNKMNTEDTDYSYYTVEEQQIKAQDLYITDDFIIIRLENVVKKYRDYNFSNKTEILSKRNFTEFIFYDIKTYEEVKKIKIEGEYKTSRITNDELYIITNSSANSQTEYSINYYLDDKLYTPKYTDMYYCPKYGSVNGYVVVFKVELKNNLNIEQLYILSPTIQEIYMTDKNLYLLTDCTYKQYNLSGTVEKRANLTNILIINIENDMLIEGMVCVFGSVYDKYWVDEYNGYLRVVSTGTFIDLTTTIKDTTVENTVYNYLTIFKKNSQGKWEYVSSIVDGLGEPGETMKSARFEGDVATIVTFKQTDPLYYVDISDPYNPKITSELKVSGFTVYQHPYKDNYVIGIGHEATSSGSVTGYKIALFDISDKSNVKQVGDSIIFSFADRYSNLGVLSNPKELFLDLENDIFGFNILKKEYNDNKYTYYDKFFTFKIDLTKSNPIYIFDEYQTTCGYKGIIDRMVFIKDKYYLLKFDSVEIYQLKKDKLEHIKSYSLN